MVDLLPEDFANSTIFLTNTPKQEPIEGVEQIEVPLTIPVPPPAAIEAAGATERRD